MPITSNNTNAFAETVSGGGGSGTPASTVVTQTSYGQSSAVGTSTDYARADHSHGTPATISSLSNTRCTWAQAVFISGPAAIQAWGESGYGTISCSGTSTVVNNKLFADGAYYSSDWSTIASSLPSAEYVIYLAGAITSGNTLYAGFDGGTGGGAVGGAGVTTDQAFFQIDVSNNPTGNFYLVTTNSAGGVTLINTGVTPALNTEYVLKVQFTTPTTVVARINGTVVATSTTNTPGGSVLMKHGAVDSLNKIGLRRIFVQDGI